MQASTDDRRLPVVSALLPPTQPDVAAAPDLAAVSVATTGPPRSPRRAQAKYQRAQPSEAEQARRQAWGQKWGRLAAETIKQSIRRA